MVAISLCLALFACTSASIAEKPSEFHHGTSASALEDGELHLLQLRALALPGAASASSRGGPPLSPPPPAARSGEMLVLPPVTQPLSTRLAVPPPPNHIAELSTGPAELEVPRPLTEALAGLPPKHVAHRSASTAPAQFGAQGSVADAGPPMDQTGYKLVAEMRDTKKMEAFITRVVESVGGTVQNQASLKGFAPFHSGELGEQTFDRLVRELHQFKWTGWMNLPASAFSSLGGTAAQSSTAQAAAVQPTSGGGGPEFNQAGYQKVVAMHDNRAMAEYIRRVVVSFGGRVTSAASLKGFAPFHSGVQGQQTYTRLVKELYTFGWTGLKDKTANQDLIPSSTVGANSPVDASPADLADAASMTSTKTESESDLPPAKVVQIATLDETGYQLVAALNNTAAMLAYIKRMAHELGGVAPGDKELAGLAPLYSGEQAVQDFASLRGDLSMRGLINKDVASDLGEKALAATKTTSATQSRTTSAEFKGKINKHSSPKVNLAKVVQTATLDEDGFQQIVALEDASAMAAYIKRAAQHSSGEVLGDAELAGLVGVRNLSTLRHELSLRGLALIEHGTDAAYTDSLGEADVVATQPMNSIENEATASQSTGKSGKRSRPKVNLAKVVQTATLDEDGFLQIAALEDASAMAAYIKRAAHHSSGEVLGDAELAGLAGVRDFSTLRHELSLRGLELIKQGADSTYLDSLREGNAATAQQIDATQSDSTATKSAHKSGKRSRPKVNLAKVVQSASLDEEGFEQVAALEDASALAAYMKRVAHQSSGELLGDADVASLAGVQDFSTLRKELALRGLALIEQGADSTQGNGLSEEVVTASQLTSATQSDAAATQAIGKSSKRTSPKMNLAKVVQTATFNEDGFRLVAGLEDESAMKAYIKRVAGQSGVVLGDAELAEFASHCEDFASLVNNLSMLIEMLNT